MSDDDDDDDDDACLLGKRSRRSSSVGVLHRICSSFFLWDPQAQCLTVSKFCFVLFCCCCCWKLIFLETNFMFQIIIFVLPFFFLSFSGFGFCRSLLL